MRLWLLYKVLLLFCLCTVTSVAAGGPKARRVLHQPRKVNQIVRANDEPLDKILAQGDSELAVDSKTPRTCKLVPHGAIAPRAATPARANKFCRPKSVTSTNGTPSQGASKSSARTASFPASDRERWLPYILTSLAAALLLHSL